MLFGVLKDYVNPWWVGCICQSWLLMNYSKCQNFSSRTFWDPELRLLINYDVIPALVLNYYSFYVPGLFTNWNLSDMNKIGSLGFEWRLFDDVRQVYPMNPI